jgi:ribosome-associated heat shock protein Hsp15
LRLDKWLWHARMTRSRSLAQKLVEAGAVRINRAKATGSAATVKIGDVLTIRLERQILVLKVEALGERRGSYSEARNLYTVIEPEPPTQPADG